MRPAVIVWAVVGLISASRLALAQVAPPPPAATSPIGLGRLFAPTAPHLDITPFGGGFASEDYFVSDEGVQIEQSLSEGLGLVGRATGEQLYLQVNAVSPLQPSATRPTARLNLGRFEGGFDVSPLEGTNVYMLGGHDIGDSDAFVAEGAISSWLLQSSAHPFNVFIDTAYDTQNKVTSSEVNLRAIVSRNADWTLMAGAGGAIYGGGFVHGVNGQGGPIIAVYNSSWKFGADLQGGYGTPGGYGELTLYKTFSLWE